MSITGPRVVYIPHSMKCTDCPKEDCTECSFARREIVQRKNGKEKPKKKTISQRQEDRERANLGLSAAGLGISTVGLAISIIALMNKRPGRRGLDDGDYEVLMSESRGPVLRKR